MKTWGWAVIFYSFFISAAAGAEVWTVELKAVEGRVTYQHGLATTVGKQSSFAGQPRMAGAPSKVVCLPTGNSISCV